MSLSTPGKQTFVCGRWCVSGPLSKPSPYMCVCCPLLSPTSLIVSHAATLFEQRSPVHFSFSLTLSIFLILSSSSLYPSLFLILSSSSLYPSLFLPFLLLSSLLFSLTPISLSLSLSLCLSLSRSI